MKKSLFLSGVVAVLMSFTIIESDGIVKALKQGNATELAKYFDNIFDLFAHISNLIIRKSKYFLQ